MSIVRHKLSWKWVSDRNCILEGDRFYLSFNHGEGKRDIDECWEIVGTLFGLKHRQAETALVIHNGKEVDDELRNVYLILNGDWRAEYEEPFPVMEKCIEFFKSQMKDHKSGWSDDLPEEYK